jgi:hypothetical protein
VTPCCSRQVRKALRLVEPPVVVPAAPVVVVPLVVAAEVEVVEPEDAELDPHAETAKARTSPRIRRPSAFAALPLVRCLFCVMDSASLSRMIGT